MRTYHKACSVFDDTGPRVMCTTGRVFNTKNVNFENAILHHTSTQQSPTYGLSDTNLYALLRNHILELKSFFLIFLGRVSKVNIFPWVSRWWKLTMMFSSCVLGIYFD